MRWWIVCVLIASSTIGHATDKPNPGRATPAGGWRGICADGSEDWGDRMPIDITFRSVTEGLEATGTLGFLSDDKSERTAKATLKGKKVGQQFVLRGQMIEVSDGTEWDIELQVAFDGVKLSGKFIELVDPTSSTPSTSLMCTFSWPKSTGAKK